MSKRYIIKLDTSSGNIKLNNSESGNKVYATLNNKSYQENINSEIEALINNKAIYEQRISASQDCSFEIEDDQKIGQ